jgi:hypothetical protein
MDCQFNTPVNYLGLPPMAEECWNFQYASCANDQFLLIQNPTTGSEYYLDKSFSYGDVLVVIFATIFLVLILTTAIFSFFFRKSA